MTSAQQGEECVQSFASTLQAAVQVSAGGPPDPETIDARVGWGCRLTQASRRLHDAYISPRSLQQAPGHSNQEFLLRKGTGELPGKCRGALLW